jgi:hypothetical protein
MIIKNYGQYGVTDSGIIIGKNGRALAPYKSYSRVNNYMKVDLYDSGKRTKTYIHRLVVTLFIGEIPKGHQVDHINGNCTDNRVINLRIVNRSENNLNRVFKKSRYERVFRGKNTAYAS